MFQWYGQGVQFNSKYKIQIKMQRVLVILAVLVLALGQATGSLQVTPTAPVLFAFSNYTVSYYTIYAMPSSASFKLDFSQTYISVPNATLNLTASVSSSVVSGATGSCLSNVCTLKLNNAVPIYSNMSFTIGLLQNPYFLMNQTISTKVTFNSSYSENLTWTIAQSYYTPMAITLNSISQSNYGVGNPNVNYTFNLSLPMTPANPQLTLTIPAQVGASNLQTALTFYNAVQNVVPIVFSSNVVFPIVVSANFSASGTIYLTASGLINPQSIGASSSFVFLLQIPSLPNGGGSCSSCTVAIIQSGVYARSTVPGNIITLSLASSNNSVGQSNNLTIYTQLLAPIPEGGKYQITLPAGVTPLLPVVCQNIYAFTISASQSPSCGYNSTSNAIYTNNFYYSGIGNVVFGVSVVNPVDSRSVAFTFQTFDSSGNMIGNSNSPTTFSASPLLLAATATKNISQVSTNFKLSVSLTLGVTLTQSDQVRVVLPQASYSTSGIVCYSGGTNISCSVSVDPVTNNLTIAMAPPCSQCSAGASLSFAVDGLTSPSFINSYSQTVIVQTAHSLGIVEQSTTSIALVPSTIAVSNYNRSGAMTVGSAYTMSFTYSIPPYISANGGILLVNFVPYDSYIQVSYNSTSQSYSYPVSLTVTDGAANSYANTVIYDSSSSPNSVVQIVINICGSNPCSSSLTISGLLRGYNPLTAMTQTLLLTSQAGDSIASTSFSVLAYNPTKASKNLAMSLTNSVTTQTSNYVVDFVSAYIPFQNAVVFALSSMQSIGGSCFAVQNSSIFNGILGCSVVNATAVQVTVNGDTTLMMLDVIDFTITITNVVNPPTVQPITYSLTTQFNSVGSQTFSTTYSIQNALPLSLSYTRSNSTYAQAATLSLVLTSNYPTFSQIRIAVPSALLTVSNSNSSSTSYTVALANSFFQVTQIYALTSNNATVINIVNPSSTTATGTIQFSMYLAGYTTASGTVSLAAVAPVFLAVTASTNSRVVGSSTDLTVSFNRVNPFSAQTTFLFTLSSALFGLSNALFNGSALAQPLTIPITTTSITINNVQNLLSIPTNPASSGLSAWTVDASGSKVGLSSFNSASLVPNTPTSGVSYGFVRSNTAIGGVGSLVISYTPRFPTVASTMQIVLPYNQMTMTASGCQLQVASGLTSCQVVSSNSTAITLNFVGQTQTILTNVANVEPNTNLLQVSIFNANGELVESSNGTITPAIQLNQIAVTASANTSLVATNSQITLGLSSPSVIASSSKLVINFPNLTYTRVPALLPQDCSYSFAGSTYSGCQYALSAGGWLTQVNITNLGTVNIPANTMISLTLYQTNAWTASQFSSSPVYIYVCSSNDDYVAQATVPLSTLHGGATGFTAVPIMNSNTAQTSLTAATSNNLTFTFTLSVPTTATTLLQLSIPISTYSLNFNSLQASLTPFSTAQNSTYYTLQLPLPCAQTLPLCGSANTQYTFWLVVNNNNYLPITANPTVLQVLQNSVAVTAPLTASIPLYSPLALTSPTISRSVKNASRATTVSLAFSAITVPAFTLVVAPFSTPSGNVYLVNSPSSVNLGASSLSYSVNSTGHLSVSVSGQSGSSVTIALNGNNNFLVPVSLESYTITIMDNNYLYYQSSVTPNDTLIPYNTGLTLLRTVTTVATTTQVYLSGTLPQAFSQMAVTFGNNSYTVSGPTFNVSLGTMTNSNNVSSDSTPSIVIKNANLIAFSSSLAFTPALSYQPLSAFASISVPATMTVSQAVNITVVLSNYSLSYLGLLLPMFVKQVSMCCIEATCSQTNINSLALSSSSNQLKLDLYLKSSVAVNTVICQALALDYQTNFVNSPVTIMSGLPSASSSAAISVAVNAVALKSTLALTSSRVKSSSNYSLIITPIAQAGFIGIRLPSFIITQLTEASSSISAILSLNGSVISAPLSSNNSFSYVVSVAPTTANITLSISFVINPSNSQPYYLIIQQSQDNAFTKIYGSNSLTVAMNQFDPITVSSVVRNATKVGVLVVVSMTIVSPNYTDAMVINFPSSQFFTQSSCSVTVSGSNLTCSVINSTAILTSNVAGSATYSITGLYNQKYFSLSAVNDLVEVSLGYPYIQAQTVDSSTTSVTPTLTQGSITLNSLSSSSMLLASPTTLTYNITIENTQNIGGFILSYSNYAYYLSSSISCALNSMPTSCYPLSNTSLFVVSPSNFTNSNVVIQVRNIVNFVQQGSWTLRSVQAQIVNNSTIYSEIDVFSSNNSGLTALAASSMGIRIILPNNYVQSSPASLLVLIDTDYSFLPLSQLALNLMLPQLNCQLLGASFQTTLTLSCSLTAPTTANLKLGLYHPTFPSINLASAVHSVPILAAPSGGCSNQMCDSCSSYNGQEYCLVCREGLYVSNGQCVSSCPTGYYPYGNSGVCEQCAPTCSSCYGYTSSQCLSCSDTTLLLSSGTCQSQCPVGTFNVQGNCVNSPECTTVSGCRLCSNTGFCYVCLPDYSGEPNCKYHSPLPPTLMIYILAPFAVLVLISLIFATVKGGAQSLLSQTIFSFSLLELIAWSLTVPIMPSMMSAMALVSFLALRIIISIVAYEVYYRRNLGELSEKLLQEESQKESQKGEKQKSQQGHENNSNASNVDNCKTKFSRFIAHFNGPDSYELLKSRIAEPALSVSHSFAVHVLFMANRWIVGVLMFYALSTATFGDSVIMPASVLGCAGVVTLCWLMTWDKFRACLQRFRS